MSGEQSYGDLFAAEDLSRLASAVIVKAILDLGCRCPRTRKSAEIFLFGDDREPLITWAGLTWRALTDPKIRYERGVRMARQFKLVGPSRLRAAVQHLTRTGNPKEGHEIEAVEVLAAIHERLAAVAA